MAPSPEQLSSSSWELPSEALPDSAALLAVAGTEECCVFERPSEGLRLFGLGAVREIQARGPQRFAEVARAADALFRSLAAERGEAAEAWGVGPLLVGGFGFTPEPGCDPTWRDHPPARLVLPRLLLLQRRGRSFATTVHGPGRAPAARRELLDLLAAASRIAPYALASAPEFQAAADEPHASFRQRVERALAEIQRGELEKVVVARSVRLGSPGSFAPGALLAQLARSHPSATSFGLLRAGSAFVGATPERLLRREGRRVETSAVAGSAPRGRNAAEDAQRARELRESKKEQAEHAAVARALREVLAPCCETLELPEAPKLLALEGIQHLETPLVGRLAADAPGLLELVGRLHPTPAVGGAPRERALAWLARNEELERGWYASPVGWIDARGDGEFVVALRCALLRGGRARLFAGAGVVEGSEAEAELRETRLKLRALLAPLLEI